jgi:hypothetical protein
VIRDTLDTSSGVGEKMIRQHWREPRFWLWWIKKGGPTEVRWILGFLAVLLVLGGGFLAADRLAEANAGVSPTSQYTFVTTIERNVTVREHGKTIVRRVPVIRRVLVRPQTMYETRLETRVITTPGGVRVVTHPVVKYVPVVKKTVVTVAGKRQVRTRTVLVPTTKIQTQTITNSQTSTVVNENTSTVVTIVQTTVPVTTTVRRTNTETTTVVSTQTLPAETKTITTTQTITQPAITVTVPITITITTPGGGTTP